MNEILLGAIIGGAIAVTGSAVVAWIQGHYSLKGKREENLSRRQQQSTQIEHENSSSVISRVIEIRSKYLYPLSDNLGELHANIDAFRSKIIGVIVSPPHEKRRIKVTEAGKKEFKKLLYEVESEIPAIDTPAKKVYGATAKVTDEKLKEELYEVTNNVNKFIRVYYEMGASLAGIKEGEDFIYDFDELMEQITGTIVGIGNANSRIESLIAGVDIDGV